MLCVSCASLDPGDPAFEAAFENGRAAREGFARCRAYLQGWLSHADPETGLIPRNLDKGKDLWNAQDSAADNYPFMVLTAALLDRPLFEGDMRDMLRTEKRITSRLASLPDTYSFSKKGFQEPDLDLGRILFGASEYIKDGLLPITEWLGDSPWSHRLIEMLDDVWDQAPVETPYGKIVSRSHEINGEMLQTLSRIYWKTQDPKYLAWAIRLGDFYLLLPNHPTRDGSHLRLRDHGCEILSGLCELYATVHFAWPQKKQAYKEPLYALLDEVLRIGRNEHGLFYNAIHPQTQEHEKGCADTWGYILNGYYTVYLIDGVVAYRDAVLKALSCLNEHYQGYDWESGSADGYADAIESALNLYNREPVTSAAQWMDHEIKRMWEKQQESGIIEGWHGDGNFARTTLMYCLWKTQGVRVRPWKPDVIFGGVSRDETLFISLYAEQEWEGWVLLDGPRHQSNLNLPLDWPRINQFPEWYTVNPEERYFVHDLTEGTRKAYTGRDLKEGIWLHLRPGKLHRLLIRK
jgi:hypothetical protein